jgi:hypothetical protein
MKISPLFLLLGLIVLPESIIDIQLFPFGRTDAAIVPLNKAYNHTYTETDTTGTGTGTARHRPAQPFRRRGTDPP